jgi:hypothetical protein
METVSTSETSVYFYQTTACNIPEDSRIRPREKLRKLRIVGRKVMGSTPVGSGACSGDVLVPREAAAPACVKTGKKTRTNQFSVTALKCTV